MVNMAQQNLIAKQMETDQTNNVQKIIQQRTESLHKKVDQLAKEKAELLAKNESEYQQRVKLKFEVHRVRFFFFSCLLLKKLPRSWLLQSGFSSIEFCSGKAPQKIVFGSKLIIIIFIWLLICI